MDELGLTEEEIVNTDIYALAGRDRENIYSLKLHMDTLISNGKQDKRDILDKDN